MNFKTKIKSYFSKSIDLAKRLADYLQSLKAKKSYMTFALIVLLIFAAIITVFVRSCAQKPKPDSDLIAYYSSDSDKTVLYYHGGTQLNISDGKVKYVEISPAGNAAAILDQFDNLYFISGTSVKFVADKVTSFVLSISGDVVLYKNSSEELYRYQLRNEIHEKISDSVLDGQFRLSPDGLSVVFRTSDNKLVFANGPTRVEVGNYYPISTSDKGRVIFLLDSESRLCVSVKGEKPGVLSSAPISGIPITNRTMTDILYFSDGENYISVYGSESRKLAGNSPVIQISAKTTFTANGHLMVIKNTGFASVKYVSGDSAYKIGEDYKTVCLVENQDNIILAEDEIYYCTEGKLYSSSSPEILASNVVSAVISDSCLFYIDTFGDLYAGNDSFKRIAYDVYEIIPFNSGVLACVDKSSRGDFTLYYSDDGKNLIKIDESCIFCVDIMRD